MPPRPVRPPATPSAQHGHPLDGLHRTWPTLMVAITGELSPIAGAAAWIGTASPIAPFAGPDGRPLCSKYSSYAFYEES